MAMALACAAWLGAACSGGGGHHGASCPSGFVGDPQAAPTFSFVALSTAGIATLSEGDGAPLLFAPQGGMVFFAGIRATNLDTCGVTLTGALRDETTNKVIGLDNRPVALEDDGTGFGLPADPTGLENYSNIPTCPSAAATRGILGTSYRLEITLIDRTGRQATGAIHVVPFCGNSADVPYCEQMCAPITGT